MRFSPGCCCVGNGPCQPGGTCAPFLPSTMYLVFVNVSGFPDIDGDTIRLDWNSSLSQWEAGSGSSTLDVGGVSYPFTGGSVPPSVASATIGCANFVSFINAVIYVNCGPLVSSADWSFTATLNVIDCTASLIAESADITPPTSATCSGFPAGASTIRIRLTR